MFAASKFTPTPRKLRREKTSASSCSSDVDKDPVHVYCRLRPLKETVDAKSCMVLSTPQEICISSESKGIRREMSYKFRHIFTSYATQKEIFDHIGFPLLEDLLKGKNGLLFAYGVTGSGKTYTLTGDRNNPGIMPRCIDTLFNSIKDLQTPKFIIKSDRMNGFEIQSETDAVQDRLNENRLLRATRNCRKLNGDSSYFVNEGTMIPLVNQSNAYAVFVSYIEIYNNSVFDLLDESSNGKTLQNKILREDPNRNMYVNGVVEVEVKTAQEAFELFLTGQKRKRMAYTNLNSESSRSHSVFNIRVAQLERLPVDSDGRPIIPETNLLTVSQLSIVDLAGSERSSRTNNTGTRLKEASAINNSLMNLRTCLEVLRENQQTNANKIVPYRDSRLTYLFKNYFEGDGNVQMIVCVHPAITDLEENLHVMKFAEMTQDVKVQKSEPKATPIITKKTISKRVATPAKVMNHKTNLLTNIPVFKFDVNEIDLCGSIINDIIDVLKQKKTKSNEIHRVNKTFRKRLVDIDKECLFNKAQIDNLNGLLQRQQSKTSNLETKINLIETKNGVLGEKNKELNEMVRTLQNTIDEKDLKLNQNLIEKERTRQKLALASEIMSQELDAKLKKQRDHLNAAMVAKDMQLKKVREALEAEVTVDVNTEVTIQPPQTPKSPKTQSTVDYSKRYTPRRRSKSCEEKWLEHNSIKPVPLGTVLQPSMKKRKSVTKLTKASDVTNPKQSKYCLLAQEQDTDGEIETKVYKGDIVPTTGGGAQVIFNDVERLRQQSPTASD
ncbi:unnamed protein product [Phyllotreta striolata]|uniref:Kinesin-like protein n=1 Tax=Phyllotreta striolata TaxID=444603 RepID=A0A9N9TGD1_PHYSR|nr:unnamed protein product [Phyllotreta striolata]